MNVADPSKEDKERLTEIARTSVLEKGFDSFPIFGPGVAVIMQFEFMRRLPNTCFVGNDRTRPLKAGHSRHVNVPDTMVPDLDNLVKIIKDSLIGVFYADDSQVVSYQATKMMDMEPPHDGQTTVWLRRARSTDLPPPRNPLSRNAQTTRRNGSRKLGN